jgi:hypothetical protein
VNGPEFTTCDFFTEANFNVRRHTQFESHIHSQVRFVVLHFE